MSDTTTALRDTWRRTAEQKAAQAWRFLRLFLTAFIGQVLTQLVTQLAGDNSLDVTQLGRKFLVSLAVPAAEVTWRQLHPALTATAVDSAPGTVTVPDPAALPVTEPVVDALPAGMSNAADAGHTQIDTLLLVATFVGVLLLLLGVTLR